MKKKHLIFPLLCVASMHSIGQTVESDPPKAQLGFRAQPIFSWIGFETANFKSNGLGVGGKFGLVADVRLGKNYAFGTGLEFLMLNGKADVANSVFKVLPPVGGQSDSIFLTSRNYKLQFLEIPLTLKLKTNQIGRFTYYVQFGGGIGVAISAKATDEGSFNDIATSAYSETVKLKMGLGSGSEVKLVRAGVSVGAGAEWQVQGNLRLMFGLSYNKGITNNFNGKNTNLTERISGGTATEYRKLSQRGTANYVALDIALLF